MNQHRILITTLVMLFSCGIVSPVFAQGEKNQTQRSGLVDEQSPPARLQIQQQKTPEASGELYRYQNQQQESPQEPQHIQEQQRTDTAGQHAVRIQNRFSYYADRLDEVAAKLQTLIAALAKIGVDIETANTTLVEAQAAIWHGRQLGQQASQAYWSIDPADYQEQQHLAQESSKMALEARLSFEKAIQLLKKVLIHLQ